MLMRIAGVGAWCWALVASSPAGAQVAPYVGETVMDQKGLLVAPWQERKTCMTDAETKVEQCTILIVNPRTKEIARAGTKWATKFEETGKGLEVRRAESTLAKARRLNPGAPEKPLPSIAAPHEMPQPDPKYGPVPRMPSFSPSAATR